MPFFHICTVVVFLKTCKKAKCGKLELSFNWKADLPKRLRWHEIWLSLRFHVFLNLNLVSAPKNLWFSAGKDSSEGFCWNVMKMKIERTHQWALCTRVSQNGKNRAAGILKPSFHPYFIIGMPFFKKTKMMSNIIYWMIRESWSVFLGRVSF